MGEEETNMTADQLAAEKSHAKKPAVGLVFQAARVDEMVLQPLDGGACHLETGKKKMSFLRLVSQWQRTDCEKCYKHE